MNTIKIDVLEKHINNSIKQRFDYLYNLVYEKFHKVDLNKKIKIGILKNDKVEHEPIKIENHDTIELKNNINKNEINKTILDR